MANLTLERSGFDNIIGAIIILGIFSFSIGMANLIMFLSSGYNILYEKEIAIVCFSLFIVSLLLFWLRFKHIEKTFDNGVKIQASIYNIVKTKKMTHTNGRLDILLSLFFAYFRTMMFTYKVFYKYNHNGQEYTGNFSFNRDSGYIDNFKEPEPWYVVGQEITIYVNKNNPKISYVEKIIPSSSPATFK